MTPLDSNFENDQGTKNLGLATYVGLIPIYDAKHEEVNEALFLVHILMEWGVEMTARNLSMRPKYIENIQAVFAS